MVVAVDVQFFPPPEPLRQGRAWDHSDGVSVTIIILIVHMLHCNAPLLPQLFFDVLQIATRSTLR